jgi:YD repeat-containing protein
MSVSRVAIISALCAAALVASSYPALADQRESAPPPQPTREVNATGPGLYIPGTRTFTLPERAEFTGVLDRVYRLTGQKNGGFKEAPGPRSDLSVFGPGWRADFLGGLTSRRLDLNDDQAQATDLDEGETTQYTRQRAEAGSRTYASATGSVLTVKDGDADATETLAQATASGTAGGSGIKPADLDVVLTWRQIAGAWRVTSVATAAYGTSTVTYDDQGRVTTITDLDAGSGPETTITLTYAEKTTATADRPGDYAGRLVSAESKSKRATYAYDPQGRLRSATLDDGTTSATTTYAYDRAGLLTQLTSPRTGKWSLTFPASGSKPKAAMVAPASAGPGLLNYPPTCPYASQWMWHTQAECVADYVAHYGWQPPSSRITRTNHIVMGIDYDHCSSPTGDTPGGYDFTVPCDMHDYGYGVIGNSYKLSSVTHHMTPDKKSAVDDVFYTTMRDYTCPAYGSPLGCTTWAWVYRQGVRLGDPQNGANATTGNPPALTDARS